MLKKPWNVKISMAKKDSAEDYNMYLDGLRIASFFAVLYLVENMMAAMDWWFRFLIVGVAVVFLNMFFKGVRKTE